MELKGLVKDLSNDAYHSEKAHLSSSNMKLLLTDLEKFHKEKILGIREKKEAPYFDEGSYLHSLVLEPETIEKEYAFFPEWRKQGKVWEDFKAENPGKTILSKPQKVKVESWFNEYKKNQLAQKVISGTESEVSFFGELFDVPIKVRADAINVAEGYIADVKTTGFAIDADSFKMTMQQFYYPLSAALYLNAFESLYGKKFDFYFVVFGKSELGCNVFKLSQVTREAGERQLMEAVKIYKRCIASGDWSTKTIESKLQQEVEEV